jgi:hypothetical protein
VVPLVSILQRTDGQVGVEIVFGVAGLMAEHHLEPEIPHLDSALVAEGDMIPAQLIKPVVRVPAVSF